MSTSPKPFPAALLPLLKQVSRSFYLSIRLLPEGLRAPVAVGYLLARATDTVADTASVEVRRRAASLEEMAALVLAGNGARADTAHQLAQVFAALQVPGPERDLILALPQCLGALADLDPADQQDVRMVLRHITRGQQLDVQRSSLQTAAELDEYTYLVAGCVGEFWTRLAQRHLPGSFDLPAVRMLALGRSYGQGLQLINILRDAPEDAANGRRYLPQEQPDSTYWAARARQAMDDGMKYALAIGQRRLRVASALPALLGMRTLALLGPAATSPAKVRMPRAEVRAVLLRAALGLGSRGSLRSLYTRLGATPGWDNPAP